MALIGERCRRKRKTVSREMAKYKFPLMKNVSSSSRLHAVGAPRSTCSVTTFLRSPALVHHLNCKLLWYPRSWFSNIPNRDSIAGRVYSGSMCNTIFSTANSFFHCASNAFAPFSRASPLPHNSLSTFTSRRLDYHPPPPPPTTNARYHARSVMPSVCTSFRSVLFCHHLNERFVCPSSFTARIAFSNLPKRDLVVKQKCQSCMGNQSAECGDWEILTRHQVWCTFRRCSARRSTWQAFSSKQRLALSTRIPANLRAPSTRCRLKTGRCPAAPG